MSLSMMYLLFVLFNGIRTTLLIITTNLSIFNLTVKWQFLDTNF